MVVLCGREEAGGWNKNSVEKLGQDTDPKDDNKQSVRHENVAVRASAGSGEGRALTAGPQGRGGGRTRPVWEAMVAGWALRREIGGDVIG